MTSFFNGLKPLLQQCTSVSITLTLDGDKITLVTTPVAKPGAVDGLKTQLVLKGTCAELDEGFLDAVNSHVSGNKDIIQQIEINRLAQEAEKQRLAASKATSKKPATKVSDPGFTSVTHSGEDEDEDEGEGEGEGSPVSSSKSAEKSTPADSSEIDLF